MRNPAAVCWSKPVCRRSPLFAKHAAAGRLQVFVWDATAATLPPELVGVQVDAVVAVFVLSAIAPESYPTVVARLAGLLRPGGAALVRDYGLYDLSQLRYKPGQRLGENFYARQVAPAPHRPATGSPPAASQRRAEHASNVAPWPRVAGRHALLLLHAGIAGGAVDGGWLRGS